MPHIEIVITVNRVYHQEIEELMVLRGTATTRIIWVAAPGEVIIGGDGRNLYALELKTNEDVTLRDRS